MSSHRGLKFPTAHFKCAPQSSTQPRFLSIVASCIAQSLALFCFISPIFLPLNLILVRLIVNYDHQVSSPCRRWDTISIKPEEVAVWRPVSFSLRRKAANAVRLPTSKISFPLALSISPRLTLFSIQFMGYKMPLSQRNHLPVIEYMGVGTDWVAK